MLNVGPLELLVVLAIALIVVGPERLPELARSVGRMLRQLRQVQDEVRDMVAMGVDDEVRRATSDLKRATGDLAKAADLGGAARKAGRTVRTEARQALRPPTSLRTGSTAPSVGGADRPLADGPAEPDAPAAPDGPAEPDAPVARDGSARAPRSDAEVAHDEGAEAEVAGPPADRLVEDAATTSSDDDAEHPS